MAKTILLVDDTSLIRSISSKAATEAGYNVVLASNGIEGLEKIKEHNIDIVFSDVNMPTMDGLDMVAEIKKNPAFSLIPIVMLTTEAKDELEVKGKDLGIETWLLKPFNKTKFLIILQKFFG